MLTLNFSILHFKFNLHTNAAIYFIFVIKFILININMIKTIKFFIL